VQPTVDQVVDVIPVRNGLMAAVTAVRVLRIAVGGLCVVAGVGLIDRDHVLVDVPAVWMVQVTVVQVVDVVVVAHGGVAAIRSVRMGVLAIVYLVGHTPTLRRRPRGGKC
jgi:hypothetical protein